MLDTLKKLLNSGIGTASLSKEKIKVLIDDLIEKGEVTLDEGKKLYSEIGVKLDEQKENANTHIQKQIKEALTKMGVPDKSRIDQLEERIRLLEEKLSQEKTNGISDDNNI